MRPKAERKANFPLRGKSPQGNRGAFPSRHRRGRMVFPLLLPVTAQYANYLPRPAPKGTRDPLPQAAFITPSEPARSVGGTHRSARSARTIEPGRRRRLNPLAFRNTVIHCCPIRPLSEANTTFLHNLPRSGAPSYFQKYRFPPLMPPLSTIIQKNISKFPLAISKLICYDNTVARNMRLGA